MAKFSLTISASCLLVFSAVSCAYSLQVKVSEFLERPKPVAGDLTASLPGFYGNAGVEGGLGTGSISRTIDGRMANFTLSAAPTIESFPEGQTSIYVKIGDKTFATPLGIRLEGDTRLSSWNWSSAQKVAIAATYQQSFPFASWTYPHSDELPIDVQLSQFSPLIPGDLQASAQPVNIQEVELHNPTSQNIEAAVMVSMPDISGWELREPAGVITKEALLKLDPQAFPNLNADDLISQLVQHGYIRPGIHPGEFVITKKFFDLNDPPKLELPGFTEGQKPLIWDMIHKAHANVQEYYEFVKQGFDQVHAVKDDGRYLGIVMASSDPKDPRLKGQLAMIVPKMQGLKLTYSTAFDAQGSGAEEWGSFAGQGELLNNNKPSLGAPEQAGAIAIKVTLTPGQRLVIPVAMAWDFPVDMRNGKPFYKYYTNEFGTQANHAFEIAVHALEQRLSWKQAIIGWQQKVLQDPYLSEPVKTELINELYYLVQAGSLLTREGRFYVLESLVYRVHDTLDVWFYNPMLASYFPELEKAIVRMHGELVSRIDLTPTGYSNIFPSPYAFQTSEAQQEAVDSLKWIPHGENFKFLSGPAAQQAYQQRTPYDPNVRYVGPLKPKQGVVHHLDDFDFGPLVLNNDLDGRASMKDVKTDTNRRWQNHNCWKDLNPKFVLMVWRAYYMDGQKDDQFLKDEWPNIKMVLARQKEFATDGSGLPVHEGIPDQTYDTWQMQGIGIMTGDLTAAALRVAITVGEKLGDEAAVKEYEAWLLLIQQSIQKRLWNGSYYNVFEGNTDIQADAFAGSTYLNLYGLKPVLPLDQVKKHLLKVYDFNFKGFEGGTMGVANGMGADGKLRGQAGDSTNQSVEVWFGVQRSIAALMICLGMENQANEILDVDYRNSWGATFMDRIPEAIASNGPGQPVRWRSEAYMRAGAIWEVQQAEKVAHGKPF